MTATSDLVAALRRAQDAETIVTAVLELHHLQRDEQGSWCTECGPSITWPCATARRCGVTW